MWSSPVRQRNETMVFARTASLDKGTYNGYRFSTYLYGNCMKSTVHINGSSPTIWRLE
ncbi:hypothetical protein Cni_G25521 [Canna indica]|uniref:Uncharacterized protein n=1 Tax=Canna indica TaxID=4628 RepID=A0AAQ3L1B4_9LILI|nr:hypothetical protein Cni_G25521 [Canna indica]